MRCFAAWAKTAAPLRGIDSATLGGALVNQGIITVMTTTQILSATLAWLVIVSVVYSHSGWAKIRDCYMMWLDRKYWTDYNIIEAVSWLTKAIIIVPGLIFGLQIWWFYILALITSATLIWASNKKLLPTLVGFNTLWIWLACMVLAQHLIS